MQVKRKSLILGCGNILRGDDGFGPKVVDYIIKEHLINEEEIEVLDVGLGISQVLLNILSDEEKPAKIVLIDAMYQKDTVGKIKVLNVQDIPELKGSSLSHSFPNREMLNQLEKMGVKIYIVTCTAGYLPNRVSTKMSKEVEKSIPKAATLSVKLASDP